MGDELTLGYARDAEEVARLRGALASRGGVDAVGRLDAHLARPRYRPEFTRLALMGEEIVGCALVAHRRRRLGSATLEFGALELLHTGSEGGEQLLEPLLGDCLGALYEQGMALATLRGRRSVYAPFGFAAYLYRSGVALASRPEASTTPERPLALRVASEEDLEELSALYTSSYAADPLAEVRALPDWRALLTAGDELLALLETTGRVAGYARLAIGAPAGSLLVTESAAADGGTARQLLAALVALAQARGAVAELLASPGHVVARAALQQGAELRLTAAPRAEEMDLPLAGVVSLTGMLESLAPELERRLAASRYAGWSGSLRLEFEAGRATLMFAAGQLTVVDGTRPADVRLRRMTLPALTQLLLGYRSAADLRADRELECDDIVLGLVDALFPPLGASEGAGS